LDNHAKTSQPPILFFALLFTVLLAGGFLFVTWRNNERSAQFAQQLKSLNQQLGQARAELQRREYIMTQLEAETAEARQRLMDESAEAKDLRNRLKSLEVQVRNTPKGLELSILGDLTFSSGSDQITSDGLTLVSRIGEAIKKNYPDNDILVEGHTDNTPIKQSRWASNRDLGAARASRVLEVLVKQAGLDPRRIAAVSYGESKPVAPNDTPAGRSANRRAVIVILPKEITITNAPRLTPHDRQSTPTLATDARTTPGLSNPAAATPVPVPES